MGALLSLLLLLASPARALGETIPAPRDAAEARAVLDGLSADEALHEEAAEQMTALLAEYRRLGNAPDAGIPVSEAVRRRAEVWSRYGPLIDKANALCDRGKAAIDAVNVAAVMGALAGTGAEWSADAVRELAPHDKRHSVLCRRNDLLISGFEEERRLKDPTLATALAREEWTRLMLLGAGAGLALLLLSAMFLKRTRRRVPPPMA